MRIRRRLFGFVVVLVVSFGLIVTRLADLQALNARQYVSYGTRQRARIQTIPAARGTLRDRNGNPLALSVPQRSVFADPGEVVDPHRTALRLAPLLKIDPAVLERQLIVKGRYSMLAHTVPDAVAAAVTRLHLRGVGTQDEFKRYRPNGDLARPLIGQVGDDGVRGSSGLELQYNGLLRGLPGELSFEMAHDGGTIAGSRRTVRSARPGADVYLTIDQALQYETERALSEQVGRTGARGGMAIVSRPSTGEVLAMANVTAPLNGGPASSSRTNEALTTSFEPGSVNKIITMSAALQEGIARPDTVLTVPHSLALPGHVFTDAESHPTRQWTVTDILAASSNIGTIELAQRLGPATVDRYLRRFGFGRPTALDFPFEARGLMQPLDKWTGPSIGAIPIGQGVAVTAMQMLAAFNVIANNGVYVAPKLMEAVDQGDGRRASPPPATRRVVSPKTAQAMRSMMAEVVNSGTGRLAAVPGYPVAGKTGTARKPQSGPGSSGYTDAQGMTHYVSTFAGFLPVDRPELSIIVVLDEPTTSIYAGDVAAPLFSRLATYALRLFRIPPPSLLADRPASGVPPVSADARSSRRNDVTGGTPEQVPVPVTTTTTTAPSPVANGPPPTAAPARASPNNGGR